MGHLTLMAVDIIGALEKYPDDLLSTLEPLLPQPAWDEYVIGPFAETQRVENIVLGGPRPQSFARGASSQTENGWGGDWNEEDDAISPVQEFRRGVSDSRQTADFGVANEEEDDGTFHFNPSHGFGVAGGWGSGSSSDSEDEHEAWIKNSDSAAALGHSRDAEDTGFDDAFADSFQPAGSESHRQLTQEEEVRYSLFCLYSECAERPYRTTASARSQMPRVTRFASRQILEMTILTLESSNLETLKTPMRRNGDRVQANRHYRYLLFFNFVQTAQIFPHTAGCICAICILEVTNPIWAVLHPHSRELYPYPLTPDHDSLCRHYFPKIHN